MSKKCSLCNKEDATESIYPAIDDPVALATTPARAVHRKCKLRHQVLGCLMTIILSAFIVSVVLLMLVPADKTTAISVFVYIAGVTAPMGLVLLILHGYQKAKIEVASYRGEEYVF